MRRKKADGAARKSQDENQSRLLVAMRRIVARKKPRKSSAQHGDIWEMPSQRQSVYLCAVLADYWQFPIINSRRRSGWGFMRWLTCVL